MSFHSVRSQSVFLLIFITFHASLQPFPQEIQVNGIGTIKIKHTCSTKWSGRCSIKFFTKTGKKLIGTLKYDKENNKTVYMGWLRIEPKYRKFGIGKILFGLFAEEMREKQYKKITWMAYPTDPEMGFTQKTQLPKLIKFYRGVGGVVVTRFDDSATMEYRLKKRVR